MKKLFVVIENMSTIYGLIEDETLEKANDTMLNGFMKETDWYCDGEYTVTSFENLIITRTNKLEIQDNSLCKSIKYKSFVD